MSGRKAYNFAPKGRSGAFRVELTANAQELTIGGLNGDGDGGYDLEGEILWNGASASLEWRFNGLATNIVGAVTTEDLSPPVPGQTVLGTIIPAGTAFTAPAKIRLSARILAARTAGGVAMYRSIETYASVDSNTAGAKTYRYRSQASWRDATDNLTSLVLRASVNNYLLAGSVLIVKPFPLSLG